MNELTGSKLTHARIAGERDAAFNALHGDFSGDHMRWHLVTGKQHNADQFKVARLEECARARRRKRRTERLHVYHATRCRMGYSHDFSPSMIKYVELCRTLTATISAAVCFMLRPPTIGATMRLTTSEPVPH